MRTFHRLVANTLIASVTNNFLWFALTFWVYLETRSVIASSVIGGSYMLLVSVSGHLLAAMPGNTEAMDAFARVNAGATSPAEFFSEENITRIFAAAATPASR